MQDSLIDVAVALDLSKKTVRRIWFNFVWAIVYNLVGVPIAVGLFVKLGLRFKVDVCDSCLQA